MTSGSLQLLKTEIELLKAQMKTVKAVDKDSLRDEVEELKASVASFAQKNHVIARFAEDLAKLNLRVECMTETETKLAVLKKMLE